jgi:hypothetical protein
LTNLAHHLFTIRLVFLVGKASPIDDLKILFEKKKFSFFEVFLHHVLKKIQKKSQDFYIKIM